MSAEERRSDEIEQTREKVYYRDVGRCRACKKEVPYPGEMAHIVAKSRANANRYGCAFLDAAADRDPSLTLLSVKGRSAEKLGYWILNQPENLALTHHGDCNDAMLINGLRADQHMAAIIKKRLDEAGG